MSSVLLGVMAGGALGAAARYLIGLQVQVAVGGAFPYGTLFVNLLGCVAIGAFSGTALVPSVLPESLRVPVLVGLLGGFTTYSAYGFESVRLIRDGLVVQAAVYIIATTLLGLLAVFAGAGLARLLRA